MFMFARLWDWATFRMAENPRYQVFISSTFSDLKDERADIFDVLMKLDCIPAGMEIFTAFDDETLEYIRRVIDQSDYYVLIIAGRYGSLSSDGLSFTEKEYEYAVSKGIPVLAFIHGSPDKIEVGKTDKDPDKAARLQAFIDRVKQGRIVQFWNDSSELSKEVTVALAQTMKQKPGIGWVRANVPANVDVLAEINELRKLNEKQAAEIEQLQSSVGTAIANLAPLDQEFAVRVKVFSHVNSGSKIRSLPFKWSELFALIGPAFVSSGQESEVSKTLMTYLTQQQGVFRNNCTILDEDLDTIKFQFIALGFMWSFEVPTDRPGVAVSRLALTKIGKRTLLELKAVRAPSSPDREVAAT
jgi:hypothetical protein